jgi:pantoate--beta-alanine ligase
VVTKLFLAVRPDVAVFGEKDFQQLAIIRRMTTDFDFGIEVVGVPTVRETDGLAMSSRNRRLGPDERLAARCVPAALHAACEAVASGARRAAPIVAAVRQVVAAEPLARLEYAEICHPVTLERVDTINGPSVLAVAIWVGGVRLIDNVTLAPRPTR